MKQIDLNINMEDNTSQTVYLYVPDNMSDAEVIDGIKKAALEYCKETEEGRDYLRNKGALLFADFSNVVPESICEKHGIVIADKIKDRQIGIAFNEPLIMEEDLDADAPDR